MKKLHLDKDISKGLIPTLFGKSYHLIFSLFFERSLLFCRDLADQSLLQSNNFFTRRTLAVWVTVRCLLKEFVDRFMDYILFSMREIFISTPSTWTFQTTVFRSFFDQILSQEVTISIQVCHVLLERRKRFLCLFGILLNIHKLLLSLLNIPLRNNKFLVKLKKKNFSTAPVAHPQRRP